MDELKAYTNTSLVAKKNGTKKTYTAKMFGNQVTAQFFEEQLTSNFLEIEPDVTESDDLLFSNCFKV